MEAAAAQLQRDDVRIERLRDQIEQMQHVIAKKRMPPEIRCPISHDIMLDPVSAADGHSYERREITAWLAKHSSSPLTADSVVHL